MRPCLSCGCYVTEGACPTCGEEIGSVWRPTVAAILLGLAATGCTTSVPLYGTSVTDIPTPTETGETGDTGDTGTE